MFSEISNEWLEILKARALPEIPLEDVCPAPADWFNWARWTPRAGIRAIIIGQDPYYAEGVADGLAFSSGKRGYIPPSLKNIFKCLVVGGQLPEMPRDGSLKSWAAQGILLLNTAFSTKVGKPRAHSHLWKDYFRYVLGTILAAAPDIPVVTWGLEAQKAIRGLGAARILSHCHPSPQTNNKFANCPNFRELDELLDPPIRWSSVLAVRRQIVYTDGSSDGQAAAYSCVFVKGPLNGYAVAARAEGKGTNIRAEGAAIIRALTDIDAAAGGTSLEIHICTDSKFWIDMIENYMLGWDEEKFARQANPDMTRKMHNLCITIRKKHTLVFRHIPAHGKKNTRIERPIDYKYNKLADELAKSARTLNYGEENTMKLV